MPPVGFESTISAGERPQTYALDRAAERTGDYYVCMWLLSTNVICERSVISIILISIVV